MNVRKAQKHMQRATELLNQSQLGFGVNTHKEASPKMDIVKEVPDDVTEFLSTKLSCAHYCTMAQVSKHHNSKFKEKCKDCVEGAMFAKNAQLRLKSITESMAPMLKKEHKEEFDEQTKEKVKDIRGIDIIIQIEDSDKNFSNSSATLKNNLTCKLTEDKNRNLTDYLEKIRTETGTRFVGKNNTFRVDVIQKDKDQEYWILRFPHLIFCHTALKKTEIEERYDKENRRRYEEKERQRKARRLR